MKKIILFAAATCALVFSGCVSSSPSSRPVARLDTSVVVEDDYEYYPGNEVYYSPAHHYYYYRDGSAWVRRDNPPHGWVRGGPSVNVHFHDAPEMHHPEMVKKYPRNWHPSADRDHAVDKDRDGHDARNDHDDHDKDKH